jgi:hypothetical protein
LENIEIFPKDFLEKYVSNLENIWTMLNCLF